MKKYDRLSDLLQISYIFFNYVHYGKTNPGGFKCLYQNANNMNLRSSVPLVLFLAPLFIQCQGNTVTVKQPNPAGKDTSGTNKNGAVSVNSIPLPEGYERLNAPAGSFSAWLRKLELKKDKTVYLFNGQRKRNQSAQYAVLNVSVGKQDLQQCADAIMRLRADYLKAAGKGNEIAFNAVDGPVIDYQRWQQGYRWREQGNRLIAFKKNTPVVNTAETYQRYLETVFSFCSTLSLEKQLKPVAAVKDLLPGDVFIKGGSPGHAVIVLDVAVNKAGKKIFIVAQSYMPAQDIHILVNDNDGQLNPWYSTDFGDILHTPEYSFYKNQLRRW
jgi:Domain of unknown function (4846)